MIKTVGIEPTICAPKTARLPAAIIVFIIWCKITKQLSNLQTFSVKSAINRRKMVNIHKTDKNFADFSKFPLEL